MFLNKILYLVSMKDLQVIKNRNKLKHEFNLPYFNS